MSTATATVETNTLAAAARIRQPTVDFVLEGVITAKAPIHVTSADSQKDQGIILIPRQVAGQAVNFVGIKGETIKGALREHAVELSIELLRERAQDAKMPYTLPAYYRNKIGGVKASEKQKPDDIFLIQQTMLRNPIAAIFGNAEPYWIGGAVEIGHAYAQQQDSTITLVGGARRDKMNGDPTYLSEFSEKDQQDWLSYSDTNKAMSAVRTEIKNLEGQVKKLRKAPERTATVVAEIDALLAEIETKKRLVIDTKADEMVGETIGRPLPSKKAIMPGAALDHKMRGNGLDLAAFGFFLKTLERWADNPRIGGHAARGFGEFAAEWTLRARINEGYAKSSWTDVGAVVLEDARFSLPDNAIVARAMEAFDAIRDDAKVDFAFS